MTTINLIEGDKVCLTVDKVIDRQNTPCIIYCKQGKLYLTFGVSGLERDAWFCLPFDDIWNLYNEKKQEFAQNPTGLQDYLIKSINLYA